MVVDGLVLDQHDCLVDGDQVLDAVVGFVVVRDGVDGGDDGVDD